MTRSEQFATGSQSGITAHAPGLPVRTITTSPGFNADLSRRWWKAGVMYFKSSWFIRRGSIFSERRNGIPSSTYSEAIGPTCPTVSSSAMLSSGSSRQPLLAIPKLLQVGGNGSIQPCAFGGLLAQDRGQPLHLLFERLAVVLNSLSSYIAARCEHVAVLADFLQLGGLAETRHVGVLARSLVPAPGVVGSRNLRHILVREFAVYTVY